MNWFTHIHTITMCSQCFEVYSETIIRPTIVSGDARYNSFQHTNTIGNNVNNDNAWRPTYRVIGSSPHRGVPVNNASLTSSNQNKGKSASFKSLLESFKLPPEAFLRLNLCGNIHRGSCLFRPLSTLRPLFSRPLFFRLYLLGLYLLA